MKKIFTLIALLAGSLTAAMATDYTGQLVVTINGSPSAPSENIITVDEQADGKYSLQLKNFKLNLMGAPMNVGTINIAGVDAATDGAATILNTRQNIEIAAGDDPDVKIWLGPNLGEVPVSVAAKAVDGNLDALINISFSGMDIKVKFGENKGYQIGNSGFETFHKAIIPANEDMGSQECISDEPDNWHSFMSASGEPAFVYLAGYNPHTFISDDVRPGSTGTHSVKVSSVDMWFTVANGTITTGRLNAAAMDAADPLNHTWLDMSQTDVDDNGDPFHAVMNGRPDSLVVWVKFIQGTPNVNFPYATVNAVITDGTYYQDPEGYEVKIIEPEDEEGEPEEIHIPIEYTNVVAKATNTTIESLDGVWQRLAIPFDYDTYAANEAVNKAILVTISTNATPGEGSTDDLYVDDLELVYNTGLSSLKFRGTDIVGFATDVTAYEVSGENVTLDDFEAVAAGRGAYIFKDAVTAADGTNSVVITVVPSDFSSSTVYTVNVKGTLDGITTVKNVAPRAVKAVYNMGGQQIKTAGKGTISITKYTDGTVVKTINR